MSWFKPFSSWGLLVHLNYFSCTDQHSKRCCYICSKDWTRCSINIIQLLFTESTYNFPFSYPSSLPAIIIHIKVTNLGKYFIWRCYILWLPLKLIQKWKTAWIKIINLSQNSAMNSNCPDTQEIDYRICKHWTLSKAFLITEELFIDNFASELIKDVAHFQISIYITTAMAMSFYIAHQESLL